jgi:uncharacterized protein (DUF305 family)
MTNTNNLIIGVIVLVAGVALGYSLAGGYGRGGMGPHMLARQSLGVGGMGDGTTMGQGIDRHFIVQMIPHHEGAIAMAKVALERSKRPEILSLAEGIVEAQEKEIDDMTLWYKNWFGSTPPKGGFGMGGGGMMHMASMTGDTDELSRVSAAEFDREFILQMIPHHEMAVMMAGMLDAMTERPEMKQLADNITTSQSREIEMMRDWLESWY